MFRKVTVAFFALAFATLALAQPGSGSCQQHPDAPYCSGGGGGGNGTPTTTNVNPVIDVSNTNVNRNTLSNNNEIGIANRNTNIAGALSGSESAANAGATSGSSSNSGANSNSGGNRLHATGGRSDSSAQAAGGSSKAQGGDAVANNDGNNLANQINVDSSSDYETAAAGAAAVFAGYCQSGTSGQVQTGGFSITNSEQFCDYIRLSAVMREAYEYEMRNPVCEPIEIGFTDRAGVEQVQSAGELCTPSEKAEEYLAAYHENLADAHSLIQQTQVTGQIDRTFGQLLRPIAVVAGLILLL